MHTFEKNLFTTLFFQKVVTHNQNLNTNNFLCNSFFDNQNIEHNIGKSNKIELYSMLIDIFKAMTNHMKNHYSLEDVMEARVIGRYKS